MSLAGPILQLARQRAGLSLRAAAARAGTSHGTLHRYEQGKVEPSLAVVERIVAAYGFELRVGLAEPDRSDVLLEVAMAALTPEQRLQTLANWERLRGAALG